MQTQLQIRRDQKEGRTRLGQALSWDEAARITRTFSDIYQCDPFIAGRDVSFGVWCQTVQLNTRTPRWLRWLLRETDCRVCLVQRLARGRLRWKYIYVTVEVGSESCALSKFRVIRPNDVLRCRA
jgi:hypothetical protein